MRDADAVNAVPIVGGPIAYGIGFVVLLLVVLTGSWARSLVTVAHEAGHMVAAVATFRGHEGFTLADGGGGSTAVYRPKWSIGGVLGTFAGYPTPCLLGLGGAYAVANGRPAAVLWISLVLLLGAYMEAANQLAYVVTTISVLGVGIAAVAGSLPVQAAVAVGLVWWMLIGGAFYASIGLSRDDGSDAASLASRTLVPRIVWHAGWAVIGLVCLWKGGGWLLGLG
jgi:peptidase M50B-like protein